MATLTYLTCAHVCAMFYVALVQVTGKPDNSGDFVRTRECIGKGHLDRFIFISGYWLEWGCLNCLNKFYNPVDGIVYVVS